MQHRENKAAIEVSVKVLAMYVHVWYGRRYRLVALFTHSGRGGSRFKSLKNRPRRTRFVKKIEDVRTARVQLSFDRPTSVTQIRFRPQFLCPYFPRNTCLAALKRNVHWPLLSKATLLLVYGLDDHVVSVLYNQGWTRMVSAVVLDRWRTEETRAFSDWLSHGPRDPAK